MHTRLQPITGLVFLLSACATAQARPAATVAQALGGTVPAELHRRTPTSNDPSIEALLTKYRTPARTFNWAATRVASATNYDRYEVHFPSPVNAIHKELNTVWCDHYRVKGDGKRPAVIVLHILGPGDFTLERMVCFSLVSTGIDAVLMKMPYYGKRKPKELRASPKTDLDAFIAGVEQAVHDVRRTASWLASLDTIDADRIGLCGISLGAFLTGITTGVDTAFPRVAMLLGGGDIATIFWNGPKEVRRLSAAIREKGYTLGTLTEKLRVIEPNAFASRLAHTDLLMFNGRQDKIVPPACAESFWNASGKPRIVWYPCGHYDAAVYLFVILEQLKVHFGSDAWGLSSSRSAQGDGQ